MYVYHTVYLKHFCVVACRHSRPDVNGQDALMTDPYVLVLRITVRSNPDTESTIGINLVAIFVLLPDLIMLSKISCY
jgi:hypothetical protein